MAAPHPALLALVRGDQFPARFRVTMSVVESAAEHGLAPLLDDAAPRTRCHPPIHRPSGRGVHRFDTCSQSAIRWAFEDACPFRLPRFAARFGTQSPVQDSGEQLLRPRLRSAGGSVPRPIPGSWRSGRRFRRRLSLHQPARPTRGWHCGPKHQRFSLGRVDHDDVVRRAFVVRIGTVRNIVTRPERIGPNNRRGQPTLIRLN